MTENLFILAASGGNPITNITTTFGVNWGMFISQLIAFGIVAFLLNKFAYKPVLEVLEKRKQRIAEGEENLKKIAEDLKDAEAKKSEIISEANAKAEKMISEARESAEVVAAKKREEAGKEAATIVATKLDNGSSSLCCAISRAGDGHILRFEYRKRRPVSLGTG